MFLKKFKRFVISLLNVINVFRSSRVPPPQKQMFLTSEESAPEASAVQVLGAVHAGASASAPGDVRGGCRARTAGRGNLRARKGRSHPSVVLHFLRVVFHPRVPPLGPSPRAASFQST